MTTYRHSKDPTLNRVQQDVRSDIRSLQDAPLAGAVLIPQLQLSSGSNLVQTGLPVVKGYLVVGADAAIDVYDEGITGGSIKLNSSGAARVSLLVF